jgi:hypothetical protein
MEELFYLFSIYNSLECLHTHYQGLTNDTSFVHFNPGGRFFSKYTGTFFRESTYLRLVRRLLHIFLLSESVYLFQKLTKIYNCTCRLTRYTSIFYSVHTERITSEVRGTITILFFRFCREEGEGGRGRFGSQERMANPLIEVRSSNGKSSIVEERLHSFFFAF